jgi:uncharacterized protein DUF5615
VRLLLDEHYSKAIAEQLRRKRYDVVAVTERPDLIGSPDGELFRQMPAERRAIVTENWAHFRPLLDQATAEGFDHHGVVFTSHTKLPRGKGMLGLYVRVLSAFLRANPRTDALRSSYCWLP